MIPDSLITELAERRCIVFVGAGLSRQSLGADGVTRPDKWSDFLTALLPLAHVDDRARSEALIRQSRFLDAAEVMLAKSNPADFAKKIHERLEAPRFSPAAAHSAIAKIAPKVLITTNYDTLLEDSSRQNGNPDLRICRYYEDHAIDVVRSDQHLLLKAHGCVTNPAHIVLTRSDYFEARNKNQRFYALLDALFLVHTVLFVGYSLQDPDIQLVLENTQIRTPARHPHYAIMPTGEEPALVDVMRRAYNIQVLAYTNASGVHAECATLLAEIANQVDAARALRRV